MPIVKHEREEVRMHFLCIVSSLRNFLHSLRRPLCSVCKLNCCVRGVEWDVGPLAWLDAPDQFPDYGRSPLVAQRKTMLVYQKPPSVAIRAAVFQNYRQVFAQRPARAAHGNVHRDYALVIGKWTGTADGNTESTESSRRQGV